MRAKRGEDIPSILLDAKQFPTPVRIVGGDYSQTRCVGGDGGTTLNLSSLNKIIEFGETEVRAQAGVRVGTLAPAPKSLAPRLRRALAVSSEGPLKICR